ncbi:linker for activation of T-cells family member 2 isoform 2-T3 [Macrochelys suwanniensis]
MSGLVIQMVTGNQRPAYSPHEEPVPVLLVASVRGDRGEWGSCKELADATVAVTRQDQIKLSDNIPVTRKTSERLQATGIDGDSAEPRYQNFTREDNQELDAAYVNPIASDYYNCVTFLRPPNEKEEDSCSYQNIVIGASNSAESDDVEDYENSASIKTWQQSKMSESPDDYPDYVNSDVAAVPN